MKLLHVVQCYYPAFGGVEGLTRSLSEELVSRHGDRVQVYTSANATTESLWRGPAAPLPVGVEAIDGVMVRRFRVFSGLQWLRGLLARGSRRLRLPYNDWLRTIEIGPLVAEWPAALAAADADVFFAASFPFLHMYYALAAARRACKPIVLLGAIHTADPWGYDRRNMLQAIRRADAYVALTRHERDYLTARHVPPQQIHVIGGGVHVERFAHAGGATWRRRYGWGEDPVILVVARQSSLKRIDIAIRAMPHVWARHPQARLVLAGAATSYTATLQALAREFSTDQQERITWINDFSEAEKPDLLAAADVLVHPSINESFALVLVEAWVCGVPVVGGDRGAIPTVIDEGVNGLLFRHPDPADLAQKLTHLLDRPELRHTLGEAGRAKAAQHYNWTQVAAQTRELYGEVLARARHGRQA